MFDPKRDLTIVVGVDANTWPQFCLSVQTWMKNRPEMWEMPWLVFADHTQLSSSTIEGWLRRTFRIPNVKVVEWPPDGAHYESQREKMLSGHIHAPALHVETKCAMKIDTDAVAICGADWLQAKIFEGDHVLAGCRWRYTKGRGALPRLEAWGDSIPEMAAFPRLNIPQEPDQLRVGHARYCSWCAFYHMDFVRQVSEMCERACGLGKLPYPSEDSTRWYVAARMQRPMLIHNMKQYGWENHSRYDALLARVTEIMA
jgi:hypothetical protein